MQYTTHYNLMLPEGTDIVNPLVQQNPNFSDIDAAMFANKQASVGAATELTAGTVHTITRANMDSNIIHFTATSNWTAGDSMVIDSTPVSVYLPDGTVPVTGAYVINTEVFMILSGTRATIYVQKAPDIDAADVPYDNTGSGMSATDVQAAIDEIAAELATSRSRTITLASGFSGVATMTDRASSVGFINFNIVPASALTANAQANIAIDSADGVSGTFVAKVTDGQGVVQGTASLFLVTSGANRYFQVIPNVTVPAGGSIIGNGFYSY